MSEPTWDRFRSQVPAVVLPVGFVYGLANFAMDRIARVVTQSVTGSVTYWPGVSALALSMILGVLSCLVFAFYQVFGIPPTDRKPDPVAIFPPAAFVATVHIIGGVSGNRPLETQIRWGVYTLLVTIVTVFASYAMEYLRSREEESRAD